MLIWQMMKHSNGSRGLTKNMQGQGMSDQNKGSNHNGNIVDSANDGI